MQVSFTHVSHRFLGKPPRPALIDINLQIPSGQFVALIGQSGCGKSTLLRLAANLLQPECGQILLDGHAPADALANQRAAWMAQSPGLLPWKSAEANVALSRRFLRQRQARFSPAEALRRVGLADQGHLYPFQLSGGMQQRVALARTLLMPADLWLMDEPFAALDELTRERLAQQVLDLWMGLRPTVLWVTHNLYEALRLAERVIVLSPGPGSVAADVKIDLPRPRDETSPAFLALHTQLRRQLEAAER